MQILPSGLHIFLSVLFGAKLSSKLQDNLSLLIMSFILITCMFDHVVILQEKLDADK